ncbi:MAG: UPF0179 family protein [Thermoplasmata archaeon]|nr:UPF0179 family protein [Thermoplasmata archaeon]
MPLITLVPEEFAEKGRTFDYLGEDPLCDECKLKTICFNLEDGARYRIIALRPTKHDCPAAEGRVRVVEVERTNREIVLDAKGAIEGSTVTFTRPDCKNIGCPHYGGCCSEAIKDGDKVTIVTLGEKADCALGLKRVIAEIN